MTPEYLQYQKAKFSGVKAVQEAQAAMLRRHLLYAKKKSAAYREILAAVDVERFELNQLARLPFTEKKDIERAPDSFLAVAKNRIADIVLSSGTTGRPLQVSYTEQDLVRLTYNEEQSFAGCDIGTDDIALLTCTMDRCFVAGLAYYLGLGACGAAVIRNGHGVFESHAEIICTMRPPVIVGVPTFLRKLGLAIQKKEQNPGQAGIKKIICIGEPLRGKNFEALGLAKELEEIWNAKVFSTYASSETITTFCECSAQRGGHLLPELAIVEIIDEEGNVLPDGQAGEIVVTPLAVEGMPLVRYKTGDISFLESAPCACGRFTPRLGPILGRKNQLMKVRGTSLYPQAVFNVLEEIRAVANYYVEVSNDSELSDRLVVFISLQNKNITKEMLEEELVAKLRVKPEIILEADDILKKKIFTPQSRKPVRFCDQRKTYVS